MGKGAGRPVKLAKPEDIQPIIDAKITRARESKYEPLREKFLEAYQELENETIACERVGVPIDVVSKWKRKEEFLRAFTLAHHKAQKKHNDLLRTSVIQRAIKGNPHFLIKNGEYLKDEKGQKIVAYYEQETQLAMFLAKNRMPDEFRDKFEFEITGKIVQILISEFSSILHRNIPANMLPPIQKELETLGAKLAEV